MRGRNCAVPIHLQPIIQKHGNQPGLPVLPVEQGRYSVPHAPTVPDGLFHSSSHIEVFDSLHLDVDARQSGYVRYFSKGHASATMTIMPGLAQDLRQLLLSCSSFSLRTLSHLAHLGKLSRVFMQASLVL